ncbi:MAG: TonB-dependent receptor [Deltaproteobacteria bacterium]|nr:TonB-dependent receptor [Deltaproteobacteria bacterium]
MIRERLRAALCVGALVALAAGTANADGVADEADLQFQLAAEAYQREDFRGALEHFLASNRLVPNRNVMFNIARTLERLSRFPDAYRYYVDARLNESNAEVLGRIDEALTRIAPNVAVLDVNTVPPGATIFVNRVDLGSVGTSPRPLGFAPGRYRVIVQLAGYEQAEVEVPEAVAASRTPVRIVLKRIVGVAQIQGEAGIAVRVADEAAPVACTTPCDLELPPGPHVLYFSREGFASQPRQVSIVARETSQVKAEMLALTGSIVVSADERDALVEVDGKPMGFTPAVISEVPIGTRKVRVSLRGYVPVEAEVEVKESSQADLRNVRLTPVREVAAASRTAEQVEDAPASVTIISKQELDAFQYPTIAEALRGVRGMALTFDSVYGNVAVRGLGQPNDYNNRLLVLGDGAVLNENILYQPFIDFDGRVDLGDVERIEIVRGPGSVLYGTGAVSGVVNLVASPRDLPTSADVSVSTFGSVGRARGELTMALGDDSGFSASFSGARSGGRDETMFFDTNEDGTEDRNVAHGFNAFQAWTSSGRAFYKSLIAQWFFTSREIEIPTGSFATIFDRPENVFVDQRLLVELRFEPKLTDDLQLFTRAYADHTYFHLDFLFDAPVEEVTGMGTDTATVTIPFEQPYHETYYGTWFGAEARAVYAPSRAFRFTLGGEATIHPTVEMTSGQDEFDGSKTEIISVQAPYNVLAAYALLDVDLAEWLRLSAGVRADSWNLSQEEKGLTGASIAEDFVSVNPRLALILKPSEDDRLKLMVGRAFRAPSTYEYFYSDGGVTQVTSDCCGTILRPETVISAELEYSRRFLEDWVALGSVHVLDAEDIIETVPVPVPIREANEWDEGAAFYKNSDSAQLMIGADLELRREFRGGWMLAAQYGILTANYGESPNIDPTLTQSTVVTNSPNHYASFRAIVPLAERSLSGAVRVTLEAPRRIDLSNEDVTELAVVTDVVVTGAVPTYGVRGSVGLYNLFDWRYALPASPFPSRTMPQAGRTLLLSASLSL